VNSVLRIALLAIACLAATGLCLMIFNSIIGLFAPCYLAGSCTKMPMTETIATLLDAIKYILYFGIFPLGAILRKRDFRKLTGSRKLNKIIRFAFALIPVFLFPIRSLLTVNLF